VRISWTDNSGNEAGFHVERSADGIVFAQIASPAPGATTYSDLTVGPATRYFYRVRARNTAGNSLYSNVADATTPAAALAAPSRLTAQTPGNRIRLTWRDNSNNETGFHIERAVGTNPSFTRLASVSANETAYNDTATTRGVTYQYRVQAFNATTTSGYSNTASATR
jgi:hypothetical protein